MTDEILATDFWRDNAHLIEDVAKLGYISEDDYGLDVTHGYGVWWKRWCANHMKFHDAVPAKAPNGPMDFTKLLYPDDTFGFVTFDPPYKLNGTPSESDERHGVHVPATPAERIELIYEGFVECFRVLAPGGTLLVKCQNQVVSGNVVWQVDMISSWAAVRDMRKLDQFNFVYKPRPQPEGRGQFHARQNYSTLLVFQKARK